MQNLVTDKPAFSTLSEQRLAELALARGPLDEARSLPGWTYTDPEFYAVEEELVLRREWLSVGRVEDVPQPGDYFATSVLREPVLVVRNDNGDIQALSGVCRHRAMVMASGKGNAKRFSCPYHAWTYDLNGQLLAAPRMEENSKFDKKNCALPKIRTEIWQGWIFINFDSDAEPLEPRLKSLADILSVYRLEEMKTVGEPLVYDQHFNWKLLPDNWENYHALGAHANSLLASGFYTIDTLYPWESTDAYSIWYTEVKEGKEVPYKFGGAEEAINQELPPELARGYIGIHIFPCHLILLSPEDLIYYKILPGAVDYFRLEASVSYLPAVAKNPELVAAAKKREQGLDFIHGVEDVLVLEGGQAGWKSRFMEQGYLSDLEKPLWQFYQYLIPRVLQGVNGR